MNIAKIIGIVMGSLVGIILWTFVGAAIGLWGLSYYVPEVFTFDWEHLLPLWCIIFTMRGIFRSVVDIKFNKD